MRVFAPAKINLSLEVLGRRSDGYHDLVSVMQTVSLGDWLTVEPAHAVEVRANVAGLNGDDNLAARAARALAAHAGLDRGCRVYIEKHVPVAAGLGGGSSDAAAVLRAMNILWDLELDSRQLQRIGESVGSDVPFLIAGGTSLVEGRGECLSPLPSPEATWFVLANPGESVSTAAVFSQLTSEDWSNGEASRAVAADIRETGRLRLGTNGMQAVSMRMYPAARRCYELVEAIAGSPTLMSGSGATVIALMQSAEQAQNIATALEGAGLWSRAVQSLSFSEAV